MHLDDEMLVQKSKQGNHLAYGELVSRYQHQVYSLARRILAEEEDARDAAQEAFIQAYRSIGQFQGQAKFSTWLYRIASNKCLDLLRRKKRDPLPAEEPARSAARDPTGCCQGPEEALLEKEKALAVREALGQLPESYRLALVLQHYHGLSYREIAYALGLPEKTVSTRIYRAKQMLKEKLIGGEADAMPAGKGKSGGIHGRGTLVL